MISSKYPINITIVLVLAAIGFWTMPLLLLSPKSGLDPSWRIGLNLAIMDNFQFGRDIIFSFGPLGFLYMPTFVDFKFWAISFSFTLFIHFLFLSSVAMLLIKSSASWKEYVLIVIALIFAVPLYIEYKLLLSVIIALYFVVSDQIQDKHLVYLLPISSFLLGVVSLIKFSATLLSLSVIIPLSGYLIYKKQVKYLFYILIIYSFSVLTLWVLSGQEVSNLPVYFYHSCELAAGYNYAMTLTGPAWHLYIGIFIISTFVYMLIMAAVKHRYNTLMFFLLGSGFIFISFKHGFVRHDDHAYIFFANILLLLSVMYVATKKDGNIVFRWLIVGISLALVIVIYEKYPSVLEPNVRSKIVMIKSSLSVVNNAGKRKQVEEDSKSEIREDYTLGEQTLHYLRDRSVDIFPWDISLAYSYEMNWCPRPIFQSYSAYTSSLDLLNAQHFKGEDAPEVVLYSFKSIDGRYPIFDEPVTFEKLLCNYNAQHIDGEFIVLKKKEESSCKAREIFSSSVARIGEPIKIPNQVGGYTFARIIMEYSWFGKIVNLFFKVSPTYVKFINTNGAISEKFRFIPDVARNGIFISQYINNVDDLFFVFSGEIDEDSNIKAIIIEADNMLHYEKEVRLEFFSIPAKFKLVKKGPNWQIINRVRGGLMAIDSVNDQLYSPTKEKIVIDVDKAKSLTLSGWAVDDKRKDSGDRVYLVFKNRAEEIILPTKRNYRPDVAKHFGENNYKQSGWSLRVNTESFRTECYAVSVRILRKNRKEYYELDGDKPLCFVKIPKRLFPKSG